MSMNAVSRERFTPAAAADAVILTCLRAPAPPILWLAALLTRNGCIVYRVSSVEFVRDIGYSSKTRVRWG